MGGWEHGRVGAWDEGGSLGGCMGDGKVGYGGWEVGSLGRGVGAWEGGGSMGGWGMGGGAGSEMGLCLKN